MGTIRTILAVDGESNFRNSMKQVNSTLKAMQASVKALSTEYDINSNKVQVLRAKKEQLAEVERQQQEKMKLLTSAVERSGEAYKKAQENVNMMSWLHGRESEQAEKARKALTSATVTYNNYRTQLAQTESQLNETRAAIRDNDKAIEDAIPKAKKWKEQWKELGTAISNVGKATANVAKVEFKAFQESVKAVSTEFDVAIKGLTAYTGAVAAATTAVGKFALNVGTSFEAGMSEVAAISGATTDQMELLNEKAQKVGSSTKFTATEASQAFKYMAMAGWEAEEMLAGIDGITDLAAASGEDLALVSDIVTDSLTAFKMEASETGKFVDILAQAATNSNTTIQKMGETFKYCAPIAGAMGYKVDDLAVAIGLMADNGVKADMAGTSLRALMTNLAAPTDNAAAVMDRLGISLVDSMGNMKPFEEVLVDLRNGFASLDEVEKASEAKHLVGKPAMAGFLALMSTTQEDYVRLTAAIDDSAGAAAAMAEIMLDNFNGALTITKSAIEGLGLSIFGTFNNNLRKNVEQVGQWAAQISKIIQKGPGYSVKNLVEGKLGKELTKTVRDNISTLSAMLPTVTETFNAFTLAGVDAILDTATKASVNILPKLTDGFFELVNGLVDRLPEAAKELGRAGYTLFSNLIPNMQEVADNLVSQFPIVIERLTQWIDGEGVANIYLSGLDILMSLAKGISDNLPTLLNEGITMIMTMIQGMVERLPDILQTGMDILLTLIAGIVDALPDLIDAAVDIVLALVDTIVDNLDEILNVALKIIIVLIEGLIKNLDKIIDKVPQILEAIVFAIIDNIDLIIEAALEIILALGDALVSYVDLLGPKMIELGEKIGEKLMQTDWKSIGQNILNGIADGLANVGTYVHDKVEKAGEGIANGFKKFFHIESPSKLMKEEVGKYIGYGVADGTAEGLTERSMKLDRAAVDYSSEVMDAAKSAFVNANVSLNSGSAAAGTTVEQHINFGEVHINNGMDIEEISYKIAELTRSYVVGAGD